MIKKRIVGLMFFMLFSIFTMTACSYHKEVKISGEFTASKNFMKASFSDLSGVDKKEVEFEEGQTIVFDYKFVVEKGDLDLKLTDSQDNEVLNFEPAEKGTKELKIKKTDKYQVVVTGTKAKGGYEIDWRKK